MNVLAERSSLEVGDTAAWSGSLWYVEAKDRGLLRLVRVSPGPGPLAAKGDSLEIDAALLG